MSKTYKVTFGIQRTEYSSGYKRIKANSLEEAKKKAQRIADYDDDKFYDQLDNEDPDDTYVNVTVNNIEEE